MHDAVRYVKMKVNDWYETGSEEGKMTDKTLYVASAGQTHIPFQENERVPFVPFEKPAKPEPPLAPLELTQEALDKGYTLPSQRHHFLPGLPSEMLDWFWALTRDSTGLRLLMSTDSRIRSIS